LKISIGICAYNEVRNVGNILNNVLHQPFLSHQELLEIIVICSGCTDGTDDIVRNFQEEDARVKLINQVSREGKARAQNIILQEAKGDVIVFLSADTHPAKGSIATLVDAIKGDVCGVNGKVIPLNESRGLANTISHFIWGLHNHTMMYENERGKLAHLTGEMFAIKSEVISKIPPNVINDDAYIAMMIHSKGCKLQYVSQAVCFNFGPCTIRDYLNQRRRVLFGHRQLTRLLGRPPRVFRSMVFSQPRDAIYLFFGRLKQLRLRNLMGILAAIVLEMTAGLLALWDSRWKRIDRHVLWDHINSTKTLVKKQNG